MSILGLERALIVACGLMCPVFSAGAKQELSAVMPDRPFEATTESLRNYSCPEWFRDAKFGIYVHWGVYSVAEQGEWYAREMHIEGHEVYKHHLATYGHPSQFGYKDFIPLWKAENFDPDAWLALFVRAGAKYFTPCAAHHDGFDLWNSKYQPFNAVNMGPKKDLLGMLRAATLRHGLRFGVTTHFDRSLNWLQTAHGADTTGTFAGVPYITDDPQYHNLHLFKYYDDNRADPEDPPVFWREYWLLRMRDLIDNYRPDLIYLDSAVPFAGSDNGKTGMRMFAYYYNANMSWHGGNQEGVITHKGAKGPKRAPYFPGLATLDIERGKSREIREQPWQTDDSIGPWGYNRGVEYKDANAVIDKLIDVVSKNGNYLLNVPPRADGTLDTATVQLLNEVGAWFDVNGPGIYATRPWTVFGEGPDTQMGNRDNRSPYTHENIRYTRSKDGRSLFAIQLGWPGGGQKFTLTRFARGEPGADLRVESVNMLGSTEAVAWRRDDQGLHLTTPASAPSALAVIYELLLRDN